MIKAVFLLVLFALSKLYAQQHDNPSVKIAVLSGEPYQMQWDAKERAMLITVLSADTVRYFRVNVDNGEVEKLHFDVGLGFVSPHPAAKAWAGAMPDGRPWSRGNFGFLSRFGQRKIFLRQPTFNSAGNLLAFSAFTPYKSEWRLMTYDLKYDNLNEMSHLPSQISFPVWSPRGAYIAFVLPSEHPLRNKAGVVRWDATGLRFLESDSLNIGFASWPDSEHYLLLTANSTAGWYVLRQRLAGDKPQILYASTRPLRFAIWIPQSRQVAFLRQEDGCQWGLWLLNTGL